MTYTKEIKEIIDSIPNEHHTSVNKIAKLCYVLGVKDMQQLVSELSNVPSDKVTEYGVWHESNIDGG